IEPLTSSNYADWKTRMEMLLIAEGLWGAVSDPTKATDATKLKACASIFLQLGESAASVVADIREPDTMWKKLKSQYESHGVSSVFQLYTSLWHLEKGSQSMEEYTKHFRLLLRQLAAVGQPLTSLLKASILIKGLTNDPDYTNFCST